MKKQILWLCFFNVISLIGCSAQINHFHVRQLGLVSQRTSSNLFISFKGNTLISSTDGLNILRGQNLEILRQDSAGLFDSNIQSDFYPDHNGNIWFCTFTGFYAYHPNRRVIQRFRVENTEGEEIESEYRVIDLVDDDLYLFVGTEIIQYNIKHTRVESRWTLGPCACEMRISESYGKRLLFIGDGTGLYQEVLETESRIQRAKRIITEPINDVLEAHGSIWAGGADGHLYEVTREAIVIRNKVSGSPTTLSKYDLGIILNYTDAIAFYNTSQQIESPQFNVFYNEDRLARIMDVEIDQDSILWVSSDGDGVFTTNLKRTFSDLLQDPIASNVTTILGSSTGDTLTLFTRNKGIILIHRTGKVLAMYSHDNERVRINVRTATPVLSGAVYMSLEDLRLKYFEFGNKRSTILKNAMWDTEKKDHFFYQFKSLSDGRILASSLGEGIGLLEVNASRREYVFHAFTSIPDSGKVYTFFHLSKDNTLFASYNEETIHIYRQDDTGDYSFEKEIAISGGIWGFYQFPNDSLLYIGNSNGLFRMDSSGDHILALADKKHLPCQVYCITGDTIGNLWMSTNNGILAYNIASNTTRAFVEKDGVRSREFNAHSMYVDEKHNIYFGGTEGVTVFNPYQVKLSDKQAPVDIYEFKINDEPSVKFGLPGTFNELLLWYSENTISFEFQSIDYADPEATHVRYKLSDYDHDWIVAPTSRGFARYANLRPGSYTLYLNGANADGVYSDEIKTIDITIIPPYYMTWWFRLSVTAFVLAIGYWIVRSYYRRKLERKDLLLKQQSLLIEKQRAVEYERNRIAAEMHDDLGSGLTRIRFLSERALRMSDDVQESEQIKRISDQSNQLVTNMSEIIWAMNSRFDTTESLTGYIRRYASEYLEEHGLPLVFHAVSEGSTTVTGEKRRNIFLAVKEILHNTVKYAHAQSVDIAVAQGNNSLEVVITEKESVGFDPELSREKGNGIYNIQKRIHSIGGSIEYKRDENDMIIRISAPLYIE